MMLDLKKRPLKSGLTTFSISVFYHTAVLLLLTHCCEGQSQGLDQVQSVTAMIGDDTVLPCHLKAAVDAVALTFEWARPDLNPRFVHVWHKRQDLHVNQHPSYKGRTSVSINRLKHGDVSLTLSKVKLSDNGVYRCYFPDLDEHSTVQLIVGVASSLLISLAGIDRSSSAVVLQCKSGGWYPEPELSWLDGEGDVLPAGRPETVRGPDGLYTVGSRVTVEKRHGSSFTCRVQQKNINQTRETHIYVPDDFFMAPCRSAASITISLVVCFTVCVLAVVFSVWKWRQNKIKSKKIRQREEQQLMAGSEEMKDNEKTVKELQRKEKEHRHMVDLLMKQRDELKQQHTKVEERAKENKTKLESVETELQKVEGLKAKDKNKKEENKNSGAPENRGLKEILMKHKWDLIETQKALDELVLSTQKLLQATEEVIDKTTEKKETEKHMDE